MHYMHLPTWSQHTALSLVAHRLMLASHWSIFQKELAMCGLDNPLIIQNTLTQAVNGDHWLPHKVPNMLLIHERQFQMWIAKIIASSLPKSCIRIGPAQKPIGIFPTLQITFVPCDLSQKKGSLNRSYLIRYSISTSILITISLSSSWVKSFHRLQRGQIVVDERFGLWGLWNHLPRIIRCPGKE